MKLTRWVLAPLVVLGASHAANLTTTTSNRDEEGQPRLLEVLYPSFTQFSTINFGSILNDIRRPERTAFFLTRETTEVRFQSGWAMCLATQPIL